MKTLTPPRMKASYWDAIESQILSIFTSIVFKPIIEIIREASPDTKAFPLLLNAYNQDALQAALRSGRIQYANGVFSGETSIAIGKTLRSIGARYDSRTRTYKLAPALVPGWVKAEASAYQSKAKDIHAGLKRALDDIQKDLARRVKERALHLGKTIDLFEEGFKEAAKQLEVAPKLSQHSREALTKDYNENMELYIQKFSQKQIESLRDAVDENATQGYRFDKLVDSVKRRYGITARHAKFLARNETSIFMAKYHEKRYEEAGITRYIWSTSHDARVRPAPGTHGSDNHRVLDGRVFFFADPPVVDPAVNRKANPGEDYNCRCVAIPILSDTRAQVARERREYREQVRETDYSPVAA